MDRIVVTKPTREKGHTDKSLVGETGWINRSLGLEG